MKLTLILLAITSLQLSASGYSQNISISGTHIPLQTVFSSIEEQSGYFFFYKYAEVQQAGPVSLSLKNATLQQALEATFKGQPFTYAIEDKTVIVKRKAKAAKPLSPPPADIEGKVTDAKGVPLPGATVLVKDTDQATLTDTDGQFRLENVKEDAVLVFTYLGYITQEVKYNGQSGISVVLQENTQGLSEVVVVGYGTQRKANLTGAVSTVTSKEIENRPVPNVALALQGLSPGLSVTRTTGQPGSEGVGIQIRGATSANGDVEPLVVVDGVASPSTTLQTMNPNDIESITVLKDAAAAAIYGAQAAGGVILVTSKKGKEGKTVFEYSSIVGAEWALNVPERMETWEELEYNNMARVNSGANAAHSAERIQILKEGTIEYRVNPNDTTRYEYFSRKSLVDQLIRDYSLMNTHNISARGGTDKLNFLVSLGYYGKQGAFKVGPDRNDRYNARINLGTQLSRHLSLDSRITYTHQKQEAPSQNTNGSGLLLYNLYRYSSFNPVFTPEGRYNTTLAATAYAEMEAGGYNNYDRNLFDGVFTARLTELAKGLEIRGVYGVQYWRSDRELFKRSVQRWYRTVPGDVINSPNSFAVSNGITQNNNLQLLVDYELSLGANHHFHVLGGYQWEDGRTESTSTGVTAMVSNDLPALNLGNETNKTNSQNINTYAFQSYFTRFNYSYADKYLLEATFRVDESSRLAPGLRTKSFPSVSVGWNLHREPWFSLPFISELKPRASWGRLGAASGIGAYDYLPLLNPNGNLVLGAPEVKTTYIAQTTVPSSRLSWETIETSNVGFDFGLFRNKLQGSVDYYVKHNHNMLTALQLPATFGVSTPMINNGELKSWGWETELRYRDRIGSDFSYSIGVNISDNKNELQSFAGRRIISSGTVSTLEGYPLNSIWGYQAAGYFRSEAEVGEWSFQDSRTGAGDVKYIDQNGDGRISFGSGTMEDPGDLVFLGTTQPRYLFGVNLSTQWKNFDFSLFLQGVGKRNFMPARQALDANVASYYQALAIHRDYWTPENPDALFPRPFVNASHNYLPSDKWVLDGSYVRMKNIQLGYSLPQSLLSKVRIARARVYFTGQDLLTLSGLRDFQGYFDPEQRDGVSADYPFFGTAAMGLNLAF